jgi:hypothetical protein
LDRPPSPTRQAEAYAAYRAASNALGRPDADQLEYEMSSAQHLARIRADERERAWAPRYVANELAGTRQAADHHRHTATLRRAAADHTTDPTEHTRLHREAREADALVTALDEQIVLLEEQDAAWIRHRLHTARTRAEADISRAIVAARDDQPEPRVTADEWLAAHHQATADDDTHRPVTADDIDHRPQVRDIPDDDRGDVLAPDLRDVAVAEPRQVGEDRVGVQDPDTGAASITRARRAIHEIQAREAWEQQAADDERAARLGRWSSDDHRGADDVETVADAEFTDVVDDYRDE